MATKVHMEALSPTMEEGQLVRWLKKEGDQVHEGDVLAEIETDKAVMELVARGSGVLSKTMLKEGGTAPVGEVIGLIDGDGPTAEAGEKKTESAAPAKPQQETTEKNAVEEFTAKAETRESDRSARDEEDVERAEEEVAETGETEQPRATEKDQATGAKEQAQPEAKQPQQKGSAQKVESKPETRAEPRRETPDENGGRVKASPLARRLAAESGVELSALQGSGPGGRIIKKDIEAAGTAAPAKTEAATEAPAAKKEAPAPQAEKAAAPKTAEPGDVEEIPVSQMRKTIAKRLVTSIGPVPTFYLTIDVSMKRTQKQRERLNEKLSSGKDASKAPKVSVNDFIIKATAEALRRHPEINASWGENVIRRSHRVHVGVAVAIEDGLITPVVRDADRKGIAEISAQVRELAGRAREKKLQPDEYTGATFSISNLGMFGIEEFTAIINPPESAILAVGAIEERAVVLDGEVVVEPRMKLTMSCDHRVIDGAMGAKFLQTLKSFLEDPLMILV